MSRVAAILVDWGTSNLRLWAAAPDGRILAEKKSAAGMRTLERSEFKAKFEELVRTFDANLTGVPAVMCGMVGSRQGWTEAPYKNIPVSFDSIVQAAKCLEEVGDRDVRILPGVAKLDAIVPDVMRSEETQLLGLQSLGCFEQLAEDIRVCMPGSHAKWATVDNDQIKEFHTSMTGELIAAAIGNTVLRHSFEPAGQMPEVHPGNEVFRAAVDYMLQNPSGLLNAIFATRPRSLLGGAQAQESAAWLSGTIIGHDVSAATRGVSSNQKIVLLGGGRQGPLYEAALRQVGLSPMIADADGASIAGLLKAASALWPNRFEEHAGRAMELSNE
ncbi:MAG: 2-dehydro-3-deoxygalactonokinase [Pseudomonadota bacterium]